MVVNCVFWDWNGTLLDDTRAAFDTLNIMLAARGVKPVEFDFYREHFSFPVRPFYEKIGFRIADEEWDALAKEYHDIYSEQPKRLNPAAREVLESFRASGWRQFIVSAMRQDLLERDVKAFGIADCFERICGVDNLDGASKLAIAKRLKEDLRLATPPGELRVLVVGDALHDKEVADAIGADCLLQGEGSHAYARLAAVSRAVATLSQVREYASLLK